jgi:hypothetical protein
MAVPFRFDPSTTRYRPQNAYWLAKASQLAYKRKGRSTAPDKVAILKELKRWDKGFNKVEGFDNKSSQAFVARHTNIVIVAFRGTDEGWDWLDNLNVPSVHHELGRVHRGFKLALDDIWPGVVKAVNRFRDRKQSVWITGHSLGGALATVAAGNWIAEDRPFHGVYTFGQPRCGDRTFARNFNIEAKSRFFRFQNNNDIVTRIPQRLMGYSHVGTFIYIDRRKVMDTDIAWWYRFVDSVGGILDAFDEKGFDGIEDHAIPDYIEALTKNIDKAPAGL